MKRQGTRSRSSRQTTCISPIFSVLRCVHPSSEKIHPCSPLATTFLDTCARVSHPLLRSLLTSLRVHTPRYGSCVFQAWIDCFQTTIYNLKGTT